MHKTGKEGEAMKLLVTGGAGFIGSNFVRHIIQKYPHYQVINLDKLPYAGNLSNLQDIENHPNYEFIQGDICDKRLLDGIISGRGSSTSTVSSVDVIVNFAAETHVDRSINNPDVFIYSNICGTQVLLDLALKYNITKYVQISTDEVYGSLGETGQFTENAHIYPNSPYSASKASADLIVRAYNKTYGLPVNITRCSNNYGPYHFPEKLIPLIIINALQDKELPIYGDGKNIRDWLYVEDHCEAIDLVLHHGKPGEIFNVGGNNERANLEIVKKILSLLNKQESLIRFVLDRPGHDWRYAIDATKIRTDLGWTPKYSFDEGIEKTVNWFVSNQIWWKSINIRDFNMDYRGKG
jgi:dTDP-glucose 4,6-dehydratase